MSGAASRPRSLSGALLSLGAAATFGVLTPAAKGALGGVGPLRGAALMYLCAAAVALVVLVLRRVAGGGLTGRGPRRSDLGVLAGMTLCGGIAGPVLFFLGLRELAAHHTAVLQHLEFALTMLAALLLLGERTGRRGTVGLLLVGSGLLLLLAVDPSAGVRADGSSAAGVLLVVGACVCWAADNTLARRASDLDPFVVVALKGGVAATLLIAATPAAPFPGSTRAWLLLLLGGGVGVGLSLVLELLALRRIGAALNAGLFATGPAFAFLWSLLFLGERPSPVGVLALLGCAAGAIALASDRHEHRHVHLPQRHRHRHRHDDGHHDHDHGPGFDPATEHDHEHVHAHRVHRHPHVHDDHHRHRHVRLRRADGPVEE
jgi:drug/metabolite transporter (DMT)-like permease